MQGLAGRQPVVHNASLPVLESGAIFHSPMGTTVSGRRQHNNAHLLPVEFVLVRPSSWRTSWLTVHTVRRPCCLLVSLLFNAAATGPTAVSLQLHCSGQVGRH